MHGIARRWRLMRPGTRLGAVTTIVLLGLAAASAFDFPPYLVAILSALAVLIDRAMSWVSGRLGARRAQHRRPMGKAERANLLAVLRDQVDGDLAERLAWMSGLGGARPTVLPYTVESSSPDAGPAAERLDVEQLVVEVRRACGVALIGDGGTGKSTLLRLLNRQLIHLAEEEAAAAVPVLLDLGGWVGDEQGSFADWVSRAVDDLYGVPSGVVQHMLMNAQVILLLDGVDEMRPGERERAARSLRKMLDELRIPTIIGCRPERYSELRATLGLDRELVLAALDDQVVRQALSEEVQPPEELAEEIRFVTTPYRLKMAVVSGTGDDVGGADLITTYVHHRLEDTSRTDYGRRLSPSDEQALAWVASHMRDRGRTHIDPDAVPYEWAPPAIRRSVQIVAPILVGLIAGGIAFIWLQPLVAALVTTLVWLSFTADTNLWFGRSPAVVKTACALSAASAASILYLVDTRLVLVSVVGLAAWVHRSRHFAPRFVTAATLTTASAAAAAHAVTSLTSNVVLVVLLAILVWSVALVVAAAVLFVPCGQAVKHHVQIEGPALNGPTWLVGMATGVDVAGWAAALSALPVVIVSAVCAATGAPLGSGLAAVVTSGLTLFLVHLAVVMRAKVVDHELPVALQYPLRTAIVLGVLSLVLGNPWKAILAAPLFLELYLAVTFIRGSDGGFFRAAEGGAPLRQLVYRALLARAGIIPFRLRHLFDRAANRLIMKHGMASRNDYTFEHSLVRDHFAERGSAERS